MKYIRCCLFFSIFVIHGMVLWAAPIKQANIKLSVGREIHQCNHRLQQCVINVSRNSTQCLPSPGSITVTNNSSANAKDMSASSSDYNFINYIVQSNGCPSSLPANQSCTISFYTNNSLANFLITNVMIKGSNTNVAYFDMQAIPCSEATVTSVSPNSGAAAGGTAVTLMGTLLSGATSVTFGGEAATSVNVVNATTITAVTPAHAVGIVDVVVNTTAGPATLPNGYTYLTTAVGQPSGGGTIACLNGGFENLIAANINQPINIQTIWGPILTTGATSNSDGATNTTTIVAVLDSFQSGNYPAYKCNNYEIDSQGNTPCQVGNACYTDWFLPATDQLNCLYINKLVIGGFLDTGYWTSTETSANNARYEFFLNGTQNTIPKNSTNVNIKCVRSITP